MLPNEGTTIEKFPMQLLPLIIRDINISLLPCHCQYRNHINNERNLLQLPVYSIHSFAFSFSMQTCPIQWAQAHVQNHAKTSSFGIVWLDSKPIWTSPASCKTSILWVNLHSTDYMINNQLCIHPETESCYRLPELNTQLDSSKCREACR